MVIGLEKIIEEFKKKELHWREMINEFPKRFGVSDKFTHYHHIVGNLMAYIIHVASLGKTDQETLEKARIEDKMYKIYYKLLEDFPDFREAEFKREGYFLDIEDTGIDGAENYVTEAEKRLI